MDKLAIAIEFMGAGMTAIILVACLAENRIQQTVDRYLILLYEVTILMNFYAGFAELLKGTAMENVASTYINESISRLMVALGVGVYTLFIFSYFQVKRSRENLMLFLMVICAVAGAVFLGTGMTSQIIAWIMLILVLGMDGIVTYQEGRKESQFFYLILMVYAVAPIMAVILIQDIYFPAIHLAFDFAVFIIYITIHVAKGIEAEEKEKRRLQVIAEVEKNQKRIMISQIQPHFIYNSLNAINYLIDEDPELASKSLSDFSDYLRMNFDSLEEIRLVPFQEELHQIETYLSMEKLRFEDDLEYHLDIKESDFKVPVLSIRPLVENAVNHGISQKKEGGTLELSTFKDHDGYHVLISDDGVGMSEQQIFDSHKNHSGMDLVEKQIKEMCHGEMKVESTVGEGTRVEIILPYESMGSMDLDLSISKEQGDLNGSFGIG